MKYNASAKVSYLEHQDVEVLPKAPNGDLPTEILPTESSPRSSLPGEMVRS